MSKWLAGILVAFAASTTPVAVYAEDTAAEPVVSGDTADASAAVTVDGSADKSAEAAPEAQEGANSEASGTSWKNVIGKALKAFVLPILGVVAILWLVPLLLKKLKLEGNKAAEALLTSLVKKGINYAESLASNLEEDKGKPDSASKKAAAVDLVLTKAKEYGIGKVSKDYVEKLIEAQLTRDKNG